jgi:hypothetical protein
MKRTSVSLALALFVGAIAYGCSSSNNGDNGNVGGGDATPDSKPLKDSGNNQDTGSGDDGGGGCPTPADLSGFTPPTHHHATALHQGVCTDAFVAAYYQDCLSANSTQQTCAKWGQNADQAHKACAQCLISGSSATKYGPLVLYKGVINANIAGCVELLDPQNGLACATAIQQSEACDHAACDSACPVTDNASFQLWQQCVTAAEAAGCKKYADATNCSGAEQDGGPAAACFPSGSNPDFQAYYDILAKLFCGGVDGGTTSDAGDGGGDAGDAASDSGGG